MESIIITRLAAKGVLNFQFYENEVKVKTSFIYLSYKDASFASLELQSEACNIKLYRFPFKGKGENLRSAIP